MFVSGARRRLGSPRTSRLGRASNEAEVIIEFENGSKKTENLLVSVVSINYLLNGDAIQGSGASSIVDGNHV